MKQIFLLLVALGFVFSAHAQDSNTGSVSWTYIEGGLGSFKPDGRSNQNGLFGGGSIGVGALHFIGELGSLDKITTVQLGGGWHGLLGPTADLFADISYYDVDYDDGLRARFGARWMVIEQLELNGFLAWTDLDLTNNSSIAFNGIYNFTPRFGVGGGFDWGDEFRTARVMARFNFGNVY